MEQSGNPVILVLEDELLLVVDIEYSLNQAGFEPVAFSRRAKAEEWLQGHTPAAAIIDVRLPDGSCSRVAKILNDRKVPFLVHTGSDRDQVEALAPTQFFAKPSDPSQVIGALKTIIDKSSGEFASQTSISLQ